MYERSYGHKYGQELPEDERTLAALEGKRLYASAADIAKAIRRDIAQAQSEGLLPSKPVTYSVTSDTFSGGCSIDVKVKGWPEAWTDCDGSRCHNVWCAARNDSPHATPHQVLTAEAEAAAMTLRCIHGAYNHDGSESQVDYFDVNYYGHVEFETPDSAAFHQREKDRLAARRQTIDAAAVLYRVKVYGSKGKRTTHLAAEVDGRQRLVCGAQLWRSSLVSSVPDDTALTCSRCAKREAKATT